jgi:hypothetical protein
MYVNLRRYPATTAARGEIARAVRDDLLPVLRAQPGFEAYCAFRDAEGAGVSVTVFADGESAAGATDAARRWVLRHREFFPERGEEFAGACIAQAAADGAASEALPYVLVRELTGMPGTQDTLAFVQQRTLPMITRSPGFGAVYTVRGDRDGRRAAVVTMFDSEAHAVSCHDQAVELLREGLPGAEVVRVLHGRSTVLALKP